MSCTNDKPVIPHVTFTDSRVEQFVVQQLKKIRDINGPKHVVYFEMYKPNKLVSFDSFCYIIEEHDIFFEHDGDLLIFSNSFSLQPYMIFSDTESIVKKDTSNWRSCGNIRAVYEHVESEILLD